ncbi:MAG: UdgX family uracil-DNA binding protein [Acidimicrobiaceae bacterium]|nr:UdgX family uracil-DNA binding protein [Acidimicrobiaceae bacterium]
MTDGRVSLPSEASAGSSTSQRLNRGDGSQDLAGLGRAVRRCRACPLWEGASQAVPGEGPTDASLMLVGEQPGDQEDRQGVPFVGPAGRVLDDALAAAGLQRNSVYLTNAVKHFKWKPRGKRRLHEKPNRQEVSACRPWLDHELALVQPEVLVLLGATAAQALLGSSFRLTQHRGRILHDTGLAPGVLATIHPSAILRLPDEADRRSARRELANDLALAARRSSTRR